MTEKRVSVTTQIKVIETITGLVSRVIVGLLFMTAGGWAIYWSLQHERHDVLVGGVIAAVFGAMILPSIFDAVKPVLIFVSPWIPVFGGRRASDPQPPQNEPEVKL